MVLGRIAVTALLLSGLGGCKQSLFDNHGGGGDDDMTDANGGGDAVDGMVQSTCGAGCLADAVADFGTSKWKYFDDHRDRTWAPMLLNASNAYVGANPANKIAVGAGALVVSTAGMSDLADPAIAFTSTTNQTIRLSIIVDIPASAPSHSVRLYRNSREDSLFTQIGLGGSKVETTITVAAFAGDRFLLALAPNNSGAADLAVSFFVNETTTQFPADCILGMQFESIVGHKVPSECSEDITYYHNDGGNSYTGMTPTLTPSGPFPEMGMAADIPVDMEYWGDTALDRGGDTTTQFWVKQRTLDQTYDTILYSDQDCDSATPGGLLVYRHPSGQIGIETCLGVTSVSSEAGYPNPATNWHFVRVVHAAGTVSLCIDGTMVTNYALAAGLMHTANPPALGYNGYYAPQFAVLDGFMDDVRVLKTALPCN